MSNIDRINRMVESFLVEHDDVDISTYDEGITDTMRIQMRTKNGGKIIEKSIAYKTMLSASGYFAVSQTLEEMYKELH